MSNSKIGVFFNAFAKESNGPFPFPEKIRKDRGLPGSKDGDFPV